jgi:hypothetical protein
MTEKANINSGRRLPKSGRGEVITATMVTSPLSFAQFPFLVCLIDSARAIISSPLFHDAEYEPAKEQGKKFY